MNDIFLVNLIFTIRESADVLFQFLKWNIFFYLWFSPLALYAAVTWWHHLLSEKNFFFWIGNLVQVYFLRVIVSDFHEQLITNGQKFIDRYIQFSLLVYICVVRSFRVRLSIAFVYIYIYTRGTRKCRVTPWQTGMSNRCLAPVFQTMFPSKMSSRSFFKHISCLCLTKNYSSLVIKFVSDVFILNTGRIFFFNQKDLDLHHPSLYDCKINY